MKQQYSFFILAIFSLLLPSCDGQYNTELQNEIDVKLSNYNATQESYCECISKNADACDSLDKLTYIRGLQVDSLHYGILLTEEIGSENSQSFFDDKAAIDKNLLECHDEWWEKYSEMIHFNKDSLLYSHTDSIK